MCGGVLAQYALASGVRDSLQLCVGEVQGVERFFGAIGDQDFLTGPKELPQSFPGVTQQRRAAGGRLEQATGRAVSHGGHVPPGHIERESG